MKLFINVLSALIILFGVLNLGYSGFTYTTKEKVAEIGPLQVIEETDKNIPFSPLVGIIAIVAGVGLLIFNRKR